MKKIVHTLHLFIGLVIGIPICIICLTGCIYTFQSELQDLTQPYRFVAPQSTPFLTPTQLKNEVEKDFPDKKIHSITYTEKDRNAVVALYSSEASYYYLVYTNPYTGKIVKAKNMDYDFFRIVLMGHYYLWLPPSFGKPLVASLTLVFFAMLLTGIVLWFPKNKQVLKQRLKIKWKASWRRTNFDLHSVVGFYTSFLAVFFITTGLVMGFDWFASSYYTIFSGGEKHIPYYPTFSDTSNIAASSAMTPLDYIWNKTLEENTTCSFIEVHLPEYKNSSIAVSTSLDNTVFWKTDHRYYDLYTTQELPVKHMYGRYSDKLSAAEKLMRMNYDIHVGAILGLPGKCVAFFTSLFLFTLPITGFMMWRGRKYKKNRNMI